MPLLDYSPAVPCAERSRIRTHPSIKLTVRATDQTVLTPTTYVHQRVHALRSISRRNAGARTGVCARSLPDDGTSRRADRLGLVAGDTSGGSRGGWSGPCYLFVSRRWLDVLDGERPGPGVLYF